MAELERLAAQDLDGLADAARAERVLTLRRLLDRLEGHWLRELAAVDACGAAGADQDQPAPSTAGWLRARLRMGATAASGWVHTARALYRGALPQTGRALTNGELSAAHAHLAPGGGEAAPTGPRGAPTQPLEVGRASRVVTAAQRAALVVRDGAVRWPAAGGRLPGVRPIICATGCREARPIWPTWRWCAGLIIGRP